MARKRRQPKGKSINPTFFVFCEGKTEETYIKYLRSLYHFPVEINVKIAGNKITERSISNYKKQKTVHLKDRTFLVYDSDVESVLQRLQQIKNVELLLSNPCFELWYLLHYANQNTCLTSKECVLKLVNHIKEYRKGYIDNQLKEKLCESKTKAISRAKSLTAFTNPSTSIHKFVEELDDTAKLNQS